MDKEKAIEKVKSVITSRAAKRVAMAALVLSVMGGGAAFYAHNERMVAKEAIAATRNEAIRGDMQEKGYTIISEDEARRIAAETIGKSESELNFTKVRLKYDDDHRDRGHDRDGRHDRRDGGHDRDKRDPGMMPQPQGNQAAPVMHPI